MEKLEGISMNIVQDNIEKLKEIFPEIFIEGKIDFEVLKQLLGEKIEIDKERYSFTWKGKAEARQIAQDVSTGTLRPSKEDSKDWDNTENLYIEGDNLEVLKLLQKSYYGKIKMIYIDPPYNTGKDFVYKDKYKDNLKNYLEMTGQLGKDGQKLTTNLETDGGYHSNWLNMMYPRLKLARNLLTDDGVIFISIDDNEVTNLRKICDEIFGEENFIGMVIRRKNKLVMKGDKTFKKVLEPLICYSKMKQNANFSYTKEEEVDSDFSVICSGYGLKTIEFKQGQLQFRKNDGLVKAGKYNNIVLENDIEIKDGKNNNNVTITGEFKWSKEKINEKLENNAYILIKNLETMSMRIHFLGKNAKPLDFIDENYGKITNEAGIEDLKKLDMDKVFDYPKPVDFIKFLINIVNDENITILDFFSGSSTTAHAVMQLNAEDGGKRKYIMVQFPEVCKEKTEAYKVGYKNICEIGEERIRRAGEKIEEELEKENSQLKLGEEPKKLPDIGFKVFKLDSSNIKEWDTEADNLKQMLLDSVDNIKSDRTSLDVLYEVLLKYGLDLNVPIEENEKFYSIGGGTLLVCINKEINIEIIDLMCEEYRNLLEIDEDFKTTVILRDSAFKNDVDKTNAMKKLEQAGIKEVRSI